MGADAALIKPSSYFLTRRLRSFWSKPLLYLALGCVAGALGVFFAGCRGATAGLPEPRKYYCDGSERTCTTTGVSSGAHGEAVPCRLHWVGGLGGGATYGSWPLCLHDMRGETVLSFGVGRDASFDMSLLVHAGVAHVHAYDPTLESEDLMNVEPHSVPGFHFHKVGLGTERGNATFMKPVRGYASFANNAGMAGQGYLRHGSKGEPISVTFPVDTVHQLAAGVGVSWIPLVKADVEGAEFDYFTDPALVAALPTSQVILEFHDRMLPDGAEQRRAVSDTFHAAGWTTLLSTDEQAVFLRKP